MDTGFFEHLREATGPGRDLAGFVVVEEKNGAGYQYAILDDGDTKIKILTEYGQYFADFSSSAETVDWITSDVLLRVLEVPRRESPLAGTDLQAVLTWVRGFLAEYGARLRQLFKPAMLPDTRTRVVAAAQASFRERFGVDLS